MNKQEMIIETQKEMQQTEEDNAKCQIRNILHNIVSCQKTIKEAMVRISELKKDLAEVSIEDLVFPDMNDIQEVKTV